jgi:hypothetical protein
MFRLTLLIAVTLAPTLVCTAQQTQTIRLGELMTPEEMRATGVNTLNAEQRAALDRWITDYTVKVAKIIQASNASTPNASTSNPSTPTYGAIGKGHWIQSTSSGGAMITLEDGSIWEVNPIDRVDTMLWLPVTDITVFRATSPVADYKYLLVNTEDGEKALAKYIGKK